MPEKVVQQQIVTLLRSIGARVYVLGHPSPADGRRHRGTGQSAGLPDLFAFLQAPRGRAVGDCETPSVDAVWIEVKATGGRPSAEQIQFDEHCKWTSMPYVRGDLDAVIWWLVEFGYLAAESLPHYRRRQEA